jgi:hypothetical protein
VATAAEDRLNIKRNPHMWFAAAAQCAGDAACLMLHGSGVNHTKPFLRGQR